MVFVKFGTVFRVDLSTKVFFYDYVCIALNESGE